MVVIYDHNLNVSGLIKGTSFRNLSTFYFIVHLLQGEDIKVQL